MATTEVVTIRVRSDGTRVVVRDLANIGDRSRSAATGILTLNRAMNSLVGLLALNSLGNAIDSFTTLQNRLRGLGYEANMVNAVYGQLVDIAGRTRTSLDATATVYQRVALATKEMGISQREVLDFTETLNRAVVVSGANAMEARNAMIQLSQGMASGRLSGDELRSVLEQLPYVADLIARQMGVTRGELRDLGAEGKISTMVVLESMQNYREEVAATYTKTLPTLGQALIVARDRWTDYIGRMDQSLGIQQLVAQGILDITANLEPLASGLLAVGAATTVAFGPKAAGLIGSFGGKLGRLGTAALANPLVAVTAAVVGLTTYLFAMRDEINLGVDDITTLGDFFRVFASDAIPFINDVKDTLADMFSGPLEAFKDFIGDFDLTAANIILTLATVADKGVAIWSGMFAAFGTLTEEVPKVLARNFATIMNTLLGQVERMINTMVAGYNLLFEKLGMDTRLSDILIMDIPTTEIEGNMADVGRRAMGAFMETFESSYNERRIGGYMQGLIIRAQWAAQEAAGKPGVDLDQSSGGVKPPPGEVDKKALRELERSLKSAADKYNSMMDSLNPLNKVQREYNESVEALDLLYRHGKINQFEFYAGIAGAAKAYNEAARPLDSYIKLLELRKQLETELSTQARNNNLEVLAVGMGTQDATRMREIINIQENYQRQQRDLLNQFNSGDVSRDEYDDQFKAIEEFSERAVQNQREMYRNLDAARLDWTNGFKSGFQEYLNGLNDVAGQTAGLVTNGFNQATDALVDFVSTGKASFSDLITSVLTDIARLVTQQAVVAPVANMLASSFGSGFGAGSGTNFLSEAGLRGYAKGGYTGPGTKYQPSGIVHAGEYVVKRDIVQQPGMLGLLEQLNNGYAEGGYVGAASSAHTAPQQYQSGSGVEVTVVVHNEGEAAEVKRTETRQGSNGQREVHLWMASALDSGALDTTMNRNFGVNRRN